MTRDLRRRDSNQPKVGSAVFKPTPEVGSNDPLTTGERIAFLKIDVQGYELEVLKGAKKILKEKK